MNWSRLIWAAVVVFIALIVTDLIFQVGILGCTYDELGGQGIFRSESAIACYFWVKLITNAVFSFFFVFIFVKGYEGKGIIEGIRYGIYIWLFYYFVVSFNQFVLYGIPYFLTWYWIVIGLIQCIIFGILTAVIYKPKIAGA
jgi:hypothetical protein